MSGYNQSEQNVGNQYNAGRDIVIVSKAGKRLTLSNLRTSYQARAVGFAGSVASAEFELSRPHTILYKRDAGLFTATLQLYVDGRELFKRQILNPLDRIEFPFQVEDVDCTFVWRGYVAVASVKVQVGGHEIL